MVALIGACTALADTCNTWIGPAFSDWNSPGNWTAGVPTAGQSACITNPGPQNSPVISGTNSNLGTAALGSLTLSAGSTLTLLDQTIGAVLNLQPGATLNNAGSILFESSGKATALYAGSGAINGNTVISGGGTLTLLDATHKGNSALYGDQGVTIENVNNTIQGEGQIGISGHLSNFKNDTLGIVNANSTTGGLYLNSSGINDGQLTATGGGALYIGGSIATSGVNPGSIGTDSGHGSVIYLATGSDVTFQTLSGNIQTFNAAPMLGTATLHFATNQGSITVNNNTSLDLSGGFTGSLTNSGSLAVNSTGAATLLYAGNGGATTLLDGGGTITLADTTHSQNAIVTGDNGSVLENKNNTISGEGQIGQGRNFIFQNDAGGTVNANSTMGGLYLNGNAAGASVINKGTLEATGGGALYIGTTVNNAGGTISSDGSAVNLMDGSQVQGGLLKGNIQVSLAVAVLDGSTHGALTNQGFITAANGQLSTLGTIHNSGSIFLNSTGQNAILYAGSGASAITVLDSQGSITLADTTHAGKAAITGDNGTTLENKNNTISGEGQIGQGRDFIFQNDAAGTVNATTQVGLHLNGTATGASVINQGTLEATGGGSLYVETALNNTGGAISTDSGHGSTVYLVNGGSVQGGTLNGNVQTYSGMSLLSGVTNQAAIGVNRNTTLALSGTIVNSGSINMLSAANIFSNPGAEPVLSVSSGGKAILDGSGAVHLAQPTGTFLSSPGNPLITGDNGAILENKNNVISGAGQIGGGHDFIFQNDAAGVVNSNAPGLTLSLNSGHSGFGLINAGTLQATGGGTLTIETAVDNTGGVISTDVGNGSTVNLNGSLKNGTLNGNIQTTAPVALSGTITNSGTLTVNSSSLTPENGGQVTISGAGSIVLKNVGFGASSIYGDGGAIFENKSTVTGNGQIGADPLVYFDGSEHVVPHEFVFKNDAQGVVNANAGTISLKGNPGDVNIVNAGTLTATHGGTLVIQTGVKNAGGLISTDSGNGSVVYLSGPSTLNFGSFTLPTNAATIQGGTLNGNIHTINGTSYLDGATAGALTNQGSLTILNGDALGLSGSILNTGSIKMNGGTTFDSSVTLQTMPLTLQWPTLENKSGGSVSGWGQIGSGNLTFQNDSGGTVHATGGVLSLDGALVSNSGIFKATDGGTLAVTAGFSTNDFSNKTLKGGGSYVALGTAASQSALQIYSMNAAAGGIETLGANTTLVMGGGTGVAGGNYALFIDGSGSDVLDFKISANQGNLFLEDGFVLTTADATFSNSGNVGIGVGSGLSAHFGEDRYVQTAGITQVDGFLNALLVDITGGSLRGSGGKIDGSVLIEGTGALDPGDILGLPIDPPGHLDIFGDLGFIASMLTEEISAGDLSETNVHGNVHLDGTVGIDVSLLGFDPNTASRFIFLTYTGSLTGLGHFSLLDPNTAFGYFSVGYGANDVYLDFTPFSAVPEPGTFVLSAAFLAAICFGGMRFQRRRS